MTHELIGYLTVRKWIGILGVTFPILLWGVGSVSGVPLLDDISSYYHTPARDIFVGALFAIAGFLFAYRGYIREESADWWQLSDNAAANIAGGSAVCVALFPTAISTADTGFAATLHWIAALGLFVMFAYFCLVLFPKTNSDSSPTDQKRRRNKVYRMCGAAIVTAILSILAVKSVIWLYGAHFDGWQPLFWLETVAVVAFGISWLVKGEAWLAD